MDTFAFIIHPINVKRDVMRKYPFWGGVFNERQINFLSTFFPPVFISNIQGIRSAHNGKEIQGWFIACPYTPERMLSLPEKTVYRKIIQTGRAAEKLGADILGLGAFTSVVGDGGETVARSLDVPVTTGDAYTIMIAVESVREAARQMEIDLGSAKAAVVGATGAIGKVCAELLAGDVAEILLIGRRQDALHELQETILDGGAAARVTTQASVEGLKDVELVLTVTSDIHAIIHPEHLRPGSIVCDVARPRDVSRRVASARQDVLVIDGGMVEVPGPVNFNFDFGFPPGKAYACMAETMALALEGRFEDYTLGKNISRQRVEEITEIATRHGFRLGGFRSFERAVTPEHIARIKEQALKK